MNVPYDYESVMHYGKTAFGSGRITIETIDPTKQNVIGNRRGFSKYDIMQMNLLYKCKGRYYLCSNYLYENGCFKNFSRRFGYFLTDPY